MLRTGILTLSLASSALVSGLPQLHRGGIVSRQNVNASGTINGVGIPDCSWDSPTGIHMECWELLGMSNHLNDWWSTNSAQCGDKGFSQCYLDSAGLITWTCDILSLTTCTPPPSGQGAKYKSYHEFYAVWNIYTINQFFALYHQALLNGQAEAVGVVGQIVDLVSPPRDTRKNTPMFGPIFGPAFSIFSSASFALSPAGPLSSFVTGSLLGIAGGWPTGLFNILFPKGSVTDVKWQDISASLSEFVDEYQKNIGSAVTNIQRDFNTFFSVTQHGAFSARISDSLPEKTSYLYRELTKWTFNQAIQARGFFIIKNPGVDPQQLQTETGNFWCGDYDDFGVCKDGYIWYDGTDSYGMARARDVGADFFPGILAVAFANNWTTPEELYLDSQKCAFTFEPADQYNASTLDMGCASNTPVCVVDMTVNLDTAITTHDSGPLFTNCPPMLGWGVDYWRNKTYVPFSYLGPLIKAKDITHNES